MKKESMKHMKSGYKTHYMKRLVPLNWIVCKIDLVVFYGSTMHTILNVKMINFLIIFLLSFNLIKAQQLINLSAFVYEGSIQLNWEFNDSLPLVQGFTIHRDIESPCLENQIQDCQEQCIDNIYLAWLGDGFCDDGGSIILNCLQWSADFGDCDLRSESKDSTIISNNYILSNRNAFSIIGASPDTVYLVDSVENGCFFVSCFISECCPYEVEILESSNTVCIGECETLPTGDPTLDGIIDILDIIRIVNIILSNGIPPTFSEWCDSDMNIDSEVNIVDILILINIILEI